MIRISVEWLPLLNTNRSQVLKKMITLTIFVFVVLFSLIKYILHIRRLESYVKHLNCRKTAFPLLGVFPFIIGKNRNQIYNEFIEFTLANETPIKAYFGPQLFIALDKPEDVKTIVMSPNCLGKTYNYDFFPVPHGILPERCTKTHRFHSMYRKCFDCVFFCSTFKRPFSGNRCESI